MDYTLIHLTTVNSTNSYSKALLQSNNVKENTVVVADYQDTGRGQGENSWISDRSKNLLFSWIMQSAFLAVSDQFILSKSVSLGIVDALREFGLDPQIKWPNDIICDNKKLGGILIENTIQGSVLKNSIVGVGLNVNQSDFPVFPFPATSMSEQSDNNVLIQDLLDRLMHHLLRRFEQLKQGRVNSLDQLYQGMLYRKNSAAKFQSESEIFEGKIVGVNEIGELEIEVSGVKHLFGFHSIKMLY